MTQEWGVRPATLGDVGPLADALARAYFDDPLISYWLPDEETRLARSARLFAVGFRKLALVHGRVFTTDSRVGAASWFAPGRWRLTRRQAAPAWPGTMAALGTGFPRFVRSIAALESRHPHEPHWYLEGLAIDPPFQRQGVATALIVPVLRDCDLEGLPAYLETQKGNVAIYQRFGFELTGELDLPRGGPHMWLMWRSPGTPGTPGATGATGAAGAT